MFLIFFKYINIYIAIIYFIFNIFNYFLSIDCIGPNLKTKEKRETRQVKRPKQI